jgi:hypothetical protein
VVAAALAVACLAAVIVPSVALAHGLVGKLDLPIPRWLFAWGAATVLIVSFVGLAVLWPTPRLQGEQPGRRVLRVPRLLDPLCGAVGVALFAIVVYAGFAGIENATANLAPTFIFVLFWVGLVFASVLFGDVFRAFNPWRAIGRTAGWIGKRVTSEGLPDPLPYPVRLGRWPAALGLLAFTWVELVYSGRDDPSTLAVLALVYAALQLVGMGFYGVEAWTRHGDGFSVYFSMFARLSPLQWRDGELRRRRPLAGAPSLDVVPGTIATLAVMIGTTSFDGFSQGPAWTSQSGIAPELSSWFRDIGLNAENALEAAFTVGLVAIVLAVAGLYRLGIQGVRTVGRRYETGELARAFAHTLIPIALAYVVAHYFSLLVYQGQALAYLASDPLGEGSDLFGTANSKIDYGVIAANGVWYVQVGALVIGHACGLMLAHDRALAMYERSREAARSQYWMLVVMIGFTSLGLWLLSAANS